MGRPILPCLEIIDFQTSGIRLTDQLFLDMIQSRWRRALSSRSNTISDGVSSLKSVRFRIRDRLFDADLIHSLRSLRAGTDSLDISIMDNGGRNPVEER